MVNIEIKKLLDGKRLVFDVRVLDQDNGIATLVVKGCSVTAGHLNGPAIKVGSSWYSLVQFDGDLRNAILKALEPFRGQYPGVQWPGEKR